LIAHIWLNTAEKCHTAAAARTWKNSKASEVTMRRTLIAIATALSIAAATSFTPTKAEARCWGCWAGAGVAAGLIGGALIASSSYAYGGWGYQPAYYGYGYAPAYSYAGYPPSYGYNYGYGGYGYGYQPAYYSYGYQPYYTSGYYPRPYYQPRYYRPYYYPGYRSARNYGYGAGYYAPRRYVGYRSYAPRRVYAVRAYNGGGRYYYGGPRRYR
jgi:hypothetical protein